MTLDLIVKSKKKNKVPLSSAICILLTLIMLIYANEVKSGVKNGINLSLTTILPTLFPFFILSDLWIDLFEIKQNSILSKMFGRLFHINGTTISSFFIGIICGFPLGVKSTVSHYKSNQITKKELESVIGIINNPSLAFVISGVGIGIYKSIFVGIILYIIVIFSSFFIGLLFRPKCQNNNFPSEKVSQTFNITSSIISAGTNSIMVSSFIIFFSSITELLGGIVKNKFIKILLSSFLEISNATALISQYADFSLATKLSLTAFALSFSGLSVHLQTFSILPKEIQKGKYILMKICQGFISSIVTYFVFSQK